MAQLSLNDAQSRQQIKMLLPDLRAVVHKRGDIACAHQYLALSALCADAAASERDIISAAEALVANLGCRISVRNKEK